MLTLNPILPLGKLQVGKVSGFAFRKPKGDQLDNADPTRDEDTGNWKCPFCKRNDIVELSEVCPSVCPRGSTRVPNTLLSHVYRSGITLIREVAPVRLWELNYGWITECLVSFTLRTSAIAMWITLRIGSRSVNITIYILITI